MRFESNVKAKMDVAVNKAFDHYRIDQGKLETQRQEKLKACTTDQQRSAVSSAYTEANRYGTVTQMIA